ncbi:hypothetical protein OQZ55_03820 [Bacillus subtilis]|uniref:Uncharacterized protein n=1 Tax=Bacillus subtilis TaxID=1423 RepID=A0AC61YXA7_BACIU|nr:hypothetical protein [Bacillus subtilis]MDK2600123.1 hypothetical protein [Bacillus stercoris]AWX21250.1 hypothetical protein CXF51_03965 [Bacillus subtilis subsp. subtilis]MBO3767032.1 hypothetical protein [Bacillus subtilis]MBU8594062.1 hypothetical protein [Bacillus subtilis]MCT6514769.1 hypothetical protein [Bacillus subtilis]
MKRIRFQTSGLKPNDWRKKNRVALTEDQQNIVDALENMLEDARNGKINKMVAVCEAKDQFILAYRGATYQDVLKMTHTLTDSIFENWYGEEE